MITGVRESGKLLANPRNGLGSKDTRSNLRQKITTID